MSVASSGRIAWVADEVQLAWRPSAPTSPPGPSCSAASRSATPAYSAADRSSSSASRRLPADAAQLGGVEPMGQRPQLGQERQAALDRPGMRELVAQHRGQRQRHLPGMAVEHVEQRDVTARDRLEQQLLAERPGTKPAWGVEVRVKRGRPVATAIGVHARLMVVFSGPPTPRRSCSRSRSCRP